MSPKKKDAINFIKCKKESIRDRLEKDENAWLKLLGSLGDFAKYLNDLKESRIRDQKRITLLEERVTNLENQLNSGG